MQGMQQMNQQMSQQQEALGMHDPTGGYQQPLYLSGPPGDHGMHGQSYHSPQPGFHGQQQQQQHNNQLLMIQQQQQQMMMSHGQPPPMGQYGTSPQHPQGRGNSPPAPGQEPTTSEDSDDSTPHPAMIPAMKRPSPEPADQTLTKAQKKPKVQKKKKKRDPNEPQKPVSAYALFFRDTQAAIKGQNPNASFGEVSKIVASMWDALDSEHKNVYKKKTEAAKKEYLKALAAYRASLVSKGAGEGEGMYGNYSQYQAGAPQYASYQPQGTIPSPPMSSAQSPPSQSPIGKKPPMMGMPPTSQQSMMQSNMGQVPGHMSMQQHLQQQQQQHNTYMQQVGQQQQHMPPSPQQQQQQHQAAQQQQQHRMSPHAAAGHMQPPQQPQQQGGNPQQPPRQHPTPPPMVSSASPPLSGGGNGGGGGNQQQQAQQQGNQGQQRPPNACIRHGCPNPAVTNPEWEDEYCSNECGRFHKLGIEQQEPITELLYGEINNLAAMQVALHHEISVVDVCKKEIAIPDQETRTAAASSQFHCEY
nr:unnamed protein product [Callosobruchus chinensis]